MKIITADSTPVYDGFGPTPDLWTGLDWITWHSALLSKYEKSKADLIWCKAWLDGVSVVGGGTGEAPGSGYVFDSVPIDDRSFNTTFRNYLSAPGNELLHDAVFSGVLGSTVGEGISSGAGLITDTFDTVNDTIKNVKDAVTNTTKAASFVIPILLIALLIFAGYEATKKIKSL